MPRRRPEHDYEPPPGRWAGMREMMKAAGREEFLVEEDKDREADALWLQKK